MKFLAFAVLPAVALASLASRTTGDTPSLSQAIAESVPSMEFCSKSITYYKTGKAGGTNSLSSFESACAYFESLYVPPVQKAIDAMASAASLNLTDLPLIKEPLTKLMNLIDIFAQNAVGRESDLVFVACQFITGDVQPDGERVGKKPNLGEPTAKMLQSLAAELTRAAQLPELAMKAANYGAKLETVMKVIHPQCRSNGNGTSSSTTAGSGSTTSDTAPATSTTGYGKPGHGDNGYGNNPPYGKNDTASCSTTTDSAPPTFVTGPPASSTGYGGPGYGNNPVPSGNATNPEKPSGPCFSCRPTPTGINPPVVTGGAARFAPHMAVGVAAGVLLVL